MTLEEEDWLKRMAADPGMLALPLVRGGKDLTVGNDPDGWQRIVDAVKGR